jgi:predicted amidohydrolase YtcJ
MDGKNPRSSAIVIDNSRIIDIGNSLQIKQKYSKDIEKSSISESTKYIGKHHLIDLQGRVVLPGLIDAHIHLEHYAMSLGKVNCETQTKQACLDRVRERARQILPGKWIFGHGWNHNNWSEGFGDLHDLDTITCDHPICLTAKSLHAAWVNSFALKLAGITSETTDPQGGKIGRDIHGELNGILFESAMDLVYKVIPEASVSEVIQAIKEVQSVLLSMGLTGVHDFDQRRCFLALQELKQKDELKLRVVKSIPWDELSNAVALGIRSGFGDDFLQIGSVKAFADGALGPRTAAMLSPYEGELDYQGILMLDSEEIFDKGRHAVDSGLSLAIHAIGDRANHEVLNAYSQLRQYEIQQERKKSLLPLESRNYLRHRIEHVQLIHPDDDGRLAQLGVIASMQPIHAPSDMKMADRFWGARAANSYAWRTQLDNGAYLAFGSDAPVESPNPFLGIHSAVTRCRTDDTPGNDGWYPEQRLSLTEALQGFTIGPAHAGLMENRTGKLLPGYLADLLVLDVDPYQVKPMEIKDIQPIATMVNGEWVYIREM